MFVAPLLDEELIYIHKTDGWKCLSLVNLHNMDGWCSLQLLWGFSMLRADHLQYLHTCTWRLSSTSTDPISNWSLAQGHGDSLNVTDVSRSCILPCTTLTRRLLFDQLIQRDQAAVVGQQWQTRRRAGGRCSIPVLTGSLQSSPPQ